MKILLAVDGSAFSKKMLAYLVNHGDLFNASNDYLVFTAPSAVPPRAQVAVGKDIVQKYYADEAEKVLAPVDKFLQRHGLISKSSWKVAPPGAAIAELATKGKFDLVVMGSHGHGALANVVMGSVATRVLASCKVPVLLVR